LLAALKAHEATLIAETLAAKLTLKSVSDNAVGTYVETSDIDGATLKVGVTALQKN